MTDLYLRDLNNDLRQDIEHDIRIKRPDLVKAIKEGQDILIGRFDHWNIEAYRAV